MLNKIGDVVLACGAKLADVDATKLHGVFETGVWPVQSIEIDVSKRMAHDGKPVQHFDISFKTRRDSLSLGPEWVYSSKYAALTKAEADAHELVANLARERVKALEGEKTT